MNKEDFIITAFTLPSLGIKDEVTAIIDLLQNDSIDYLHLRKPEASVSDIRNLLKEIPDYLHGRIWLCDATELAEEFNVAGIHLNSRTSYIPKSNIYVTRGCHSPEELERPLPSDQMVMSFQFLSPIFDSISKPGYKGRFQLEALSPYITGKRVVALGGVTPQRFVQLKKSGFYGAAMLGAVWNNKIRI